MGSIVAEIADKIASAGGGERSELEVRGGTGAAGGGILTLSTSELSTVDGDILGRIDFQAPLDEAEGDAILVPASIWAEADATFSSTVNNTELVFATGASEAAAEKMRITSDGKVGIGATAPDRMLEIEGSEAAIHLDSSANAFLQIDRGAADDIAQITYSTAGSSTWFAGMADSDSSGFDGSEFFIGEASGGASDAHFIIQASGDINMSNVTCSSFVCNSATAGSKVPVQTQLTNIGSDQNSNGTYTCPTSGSYMCMFTAMQTTGGSSNLAVSLEKNDSAVGAAAYALGGNYIRGTMFQVISCSANDTLHWELWSGYKDLHGGYSNISFYLIR